MNCAIKYKSVSFKKTNWFLLLFSLNSFLFAQDPYKEKRDRFYDLCLQEARTTMNEGPARQYCHCYVEFVFNMIIANKKIPADSTLKHQADTCRENAIKVYGELTFHQKWDEKKQKDFLSACENKLKGSSINSSYCQCTLDRLMQLYPDPQQVLGLPEDELDKISADCLLKK